MNFKMKQQIKVISLGRKKGIPGFKFPSQRHGTARKARISVASFRHLNFLYNNGRERIIKLKLPEHFGSTETFGPGITSVKMKSVVVA